MLEDRTFLEAASSRKRLQFRRRVVIDWWPPTHPGTPERRGYSTSIRGGIWHLVRGGRCLLSHGIRAEIAESYDDFARHAWTPTRPQLCASIVRIQVLYGDNMSKPNIRKITADPTKCNTDSLRRPSVFERLGTKPAIAAAAAAAAAAQSTSDYCRNWALNGSCSYGKSCKWAISVDLSKLHAGMRAVRSDQKVILFH